VQGSREFFLAAQREAVFSDGGCEVLECRSTSHYLLLHLYTISKEPMYKGKLCATLDTFSFSHLIVVEVPFHTHLMFSFIECSILVVSKPVISVCPYFKSTAVQRRLLLQKSGALCDILTE
jgi:hypothetical protein